MSASTPNIDFLRGLLREFDALEQPTAILNRIEAGILGLGDRLARLEQKDETMTGELTKLQSDVAAENTVISSAITLINGFGAALAAAGTDQAALTALSQSISSNSSALAQAVAANTPAATDAPSPTGDAPTPAPTPDAPVSDAPTPDAPTGLTPNPSGT